MKPSDVRAKPGGLVLTRGAGAFTVWREIPRGAGPEGRAGTVMPGSLGVVVTVNGSWTYVLWSMPSVAGWVADAFLRPV